MRRINIILAVLIVLIGAPYYWLLLDTTSFDTKAKPIQISQLRKLAASKRGALPTEIRYEIIGSRDISGNLVAAGMGLMEIPLDLIAFQIVTPGKPSITIDSGLAPDLVPEFHIERYSPEAQARIARTVAQASTTLNLGPGPMHMGGVNDDSWYERAKGNGPKRSRQIRPTQAATAPYAVAPGVVAIPVSGMAKGTTMIFVRLSNGNEFLFTGDVAPIPESWRSITLPARWATNRNLPVSRHELASWLKTIRALKRQSHSLQIVEGNYWLLPPQLVEGFTPEPDRAKLDNMSHSADR